MDNMTGAEKAKAVSYTHLDVYKRQSLGMEQICPGGQCSLPVWIRLISREPSFKMCIRDRYDA